MPISRRKTLIVLRLWILIWRREMKFHCQHKKKGFCHLTGKMEEIWGGEKQFKWLENSWEKYNRNAVRAVSCFSVG